MAVIMDIDPKNPYKPPPGARPKVADILKGAAGAVGGAAAGAAGITGLKGAADVHTRPTGEEETEPSAPKTAKEAAEQFEKDLPGYTAAQIAGAGDTARMNLATEIEAAKRAANARGLLYSGVEAGNENLARAMEGSNLATNIQNINAAAEAQKSYLQQSAVAEAQSLEQFNIGMEALKATASQTAYEQALKEQANQNQFYSGLFQGVGSILGSAFGALGGGGNME